MSQVKESLLVRGGRLITEVDEVVGDLLVEDGKIAMIGSDLSSQGADREIDARGRYVLPGCIDPHTHMKMPFGPTFTCDDFTSGGIAGAFGGTTSHVDFCMQAKGQTLDEALDTWFGKLEEGPPVIDVGFHIAVTDLSSPERLDELRRLPERGVTSFKLFMAYKDSFMVNDDTLFRTMEVAAETGSLIMVHAENGDVIDLLIRRALEAGQTGVRHHLLTRPPELEVEATGRAIELARLSGANLYVVHISNGAAATLVERAREEGQAVWGETCSQYLALDDSVLDTDDFEAARYVFSPPARDISEQDRLWEKLASGSLSVVASDHAPFRMKQRALGKDDFSQIPNGAPGIEERLLLVHELGVRPGRISLNQMVGLLSTHPAKLFGLYPRKGTIAVGCDADLVVFDPEVELTLSVDWLHSRTDYSVYEGIKVKGAPVDVLVRGQEIIRDRELVAEPGTGRFIARGLPVTGPTRKRSGR